MTGAPQFVDLQTHSTASDGALAPADVVAAAKVAGLHAIALTDHDTVDGIPEALAAGASLGVRVVPGVELSTHFGEDELHLLGLHLQDMDGMAEALRLLQDGRRVRAQEIVRLLNLHGIPITLDVVMAEAGDAAVGRPHVARAMVTGGWVSEFREAFDRWIGWGRPAFVGKPRFEVADGIALVHKAGGIAVWAHPGDQATPTRIAVLAEQGLDGVEVLHPSHPPYQADRIFAAVDAAGLLPSGGSDWHGTTDGHRRLGGQLVPKAWLDLQDARVHARRTEAGTA